MSKKNIIYDNEDFNIDGYFNKKYKFTSDSSWILPKRVYVSEKWTIPEFQEKKNALNQVKEKLSKYNLTEWSKHTKNRDPSSFIIRTIRNKFNVELLTQAWCKFYECATHYNLVPKISIDRNSIYSVHLCEAPGAFICALNHFLVSHHPNIKWKWLATTLNPNYEGNSLSQMIPDDRLIQHTSENWNFGCDYTGDITKYYNHLSLIEAFTKNGKAQLVTADGSIDCMTNPGDQERCVEFLHYCEVVTALEILELTGTLVIKIFTTFEESSVCLQYLLNCCFDEVHFFKPCSSKSGNSEVYVICLNYKGIPDETLSSLKELYMMGSTDRSMFDFQDLSKTFLRQIFHCSEFFMEKQILTINENIKYFKRKCRYEMEKLKQIKNLVAERFLKECFISDILTKNKIVKNVNISNPFLCNFHSFPTEYRPIKLNVNNLICCNNLDLNTILDIKIGKYLVNIYHFKFGPMSYFSKRQTNESLYHVAFTSLIQHNNIINPIDFNLNSDISLMHRLFFCKVRENLEPNKNLIMMKIPLVTTFMVGLVFLLMLGFKTVWFINSTIVFEYPDNEKIKILKNHLENIDIAYQMLNRDTNGDFKKDVLELVRLNILKCDYFFQNIWRYNCNVAKLCTL